MKPTVLFWMLLASPGLCFVPSPFATGTKTTLSSSSSFQSWNIANTNHNDVDNNNDNNNSDLNKLSVTELKRLLSERGLDFRDCLEKYELVQRLLQSDPVRGNSDRHNKMDPLTEYERGIISNFKKASPSVAYIQTMSKTLGTQKGFELRGMEVPAGTGSGFLWDTRGHVVTNYQ
jgi:ARMET, C-terminal